MTREVRAVLKCLWILPPCLPKFGVISLFFPLFDSFPLFLILSITLFPLSPSFLSSFLILTLGHKFSYESGVYIKGSHWKVIYSNLYNSNRLQSVFSSCPNENLKQFAVAVTFPSWICLLICLCFLLGSLLILDGKKCLKRTLLHCWWECK